jgi:murein DD-endopeptidase MepM/ murein hydrolase activator NlpD
MSAHTSSDAIRRFRERRFAVRSHRAVPARGATRGLSRVAGLAGVVTLVAMVGSACGQFPQAHREAVVQARAAAAVAVATPTPATSTQPQQGTARTTYGSYDSPVQAPKNPTISGGKSTVNFSKFFPTSRPVNKGSRHPGTSGTGSGAGSSSGTKDGSGSGKASGAGSGRHPGTGNATKKRSNGENGAKPGKPAIKGRNQQRTPPVSVPKLADLVSREMRRGARYNSTVLPPGFPFTICPLWGRYAYSDSYGAPRYAGGYHPHAGNDLFANQGTPVLAPFNGVATRVPNTLGGNAVEVRGVQGYVYNAHLVAYGKSGNVQAGDVVGFVGNTGDAQGGATHDHFEWHPYHVQSYDRVIAGTNGAVDPFPYLQVVCPPNS